jgi:hypothetical protein
MAQVEHDRPRWAEMRRQDISADVPLTLFDAEPAPRATVPAEPDRYGTPDMFTAAGES